MPAKRHSKASVAGQDGLLLLQSQALAQEEEAKAKRELLTRFLKVRGDLGTWQRFPTRRPAPGPLPTVHSPQDKLAKEQHSSTLNLHKLNVQWQAILREAKAKELRQDVEILSQTFARVMDCKDSAIEVGAGLVGRGQRRGPPVNPAKSPQSLVTDLEEAEEQHARALRSHLHNVDRLLQLQSCRLACLEEGYSAQLSALQSEFEAERYGGAGTAVAPAVLELNPLAAWSGRLRIPSVSSSPVFSPARPSSSSTSERAATCGTWR